MRGYPQWRWHLDQVFVKVNGKLCSISGAPSTMKARSRRLWSRQDGSVCSPRFDNCGMPFASMVDEEIGMPAVERVELLLQAMLGRDAGVDGATQTRLAALGLLGDAASPVFGRAAVPSVSARFGFHSSSSVTCTQRSMLTIANRKRDPTNRSVRSPRR